jgi:hypothetical protein
MLPISEFNTFDYFTRLSDEESALISEGDGAGLLTALASSGDTGIIVALGNGACDSPSHCGQATSPLGSAIGGGSEVIAPAAKTRSISIPKNLHNSRSKLKLLGFLFVGNITIEPCELLS